VANHKERLRCILLLPSSFSPQSHQVLLTLSGETSCQQVQRCCYAKWLITKSGSAAFLLLPSSISPQSHQVLLILSGATSCQQVQRCCYAKWLITKSGSAALFTSVVCRPSSKSYLPASPAIPPASAGNC
jgi:hypothetical protein